MRRVCAGWVWVLLLVGIADAQSEDAGDLAKESQNPVGNLVSLPFQNTTSFGIGPEDARSNVLNLKPVYPVSLGKRWNLINRGVVPLVYQQEVIPGTGSASGLGDIGYTGYISPAQSGSVVWGIGPSVLLPTATDDGFASNKLSVGPGVVVLTMPGSWVVGFLAENVWSVAGDDDAADINMLTFQVIMNYNLKNGWYLTSGPVITANWESESENRWTVPVGGGFGKIMRWGKQSVDGRIQAFYNVVQPEPAVAQLPNIQHQGNKWSIQLQIKLLFPKS